jgi:2-C-methyl-D-erythritol 4-phosphate cytidylyltransferase
VTADTAIIVVAAGRSTRMGFDKVWADLGGQPLLAHALRQAACARPAELVLVVAPDRLAEAGRHANGARVVAGGVRRRDSVANGLAATTAAWVAVHDAARALVPHRLFRDGFVAARATGAAIPALPLKDTVKHVVDGHVRATLARADHVVVQTPQVFARDILSRALDSSDDDVTDEAALVERLGVRVVTFAGDERNFKVTTPLDLELARLLLHHAQGR